MKTAFLLRFQESCPDKDNPVSVYGTSSAIVLKQNAIGCGSGVVATVVPNRRPLTIPALLAGTTTHTLAGHESSDTDPDRKKFHAIPRCY